MDEIAQTALDTAECQNLFLAYKAFIGLTGNELNGSRAENSSRSHMVLHGTVGLAKTCSFGSEVL